MTSSVRGLVVRADGPDRWVVDRLDPATDRWWRLTIARHLGENGRATYGVVAHPHGPVAGRVPIAEFAQMLADLPCPETFIHGTEDVAVPVE